MFRSLLLAAVLLSIAAHVALAQQSLGQEPPAGPSEEATTEASDFEAVHDAIRALRDDVLAAIRAKDVDAILSCFHEDAVLTTQDGEVLSAVRKHAGLESYMQRLFIGPDAGVKELQLNVEVDELTILHGDDCGVAFGSSNDHYVLRDGKEFDLATRWSATVVPAGDQWVIANLHVSTNLFDNPVVQAYKRWMLIGSGVGVLLGLLVGAIFSRMTRKPPVPAGA